MYTVYTYLYMEVLVLDGKEFVKASKAAKELGYASDYVGQLCRGGKIAAHLVGRTWYVNKLELSSHKTEKKRNSRVKAREYAKKTIEEHRIKQKEEGQNIHRNIDISYESDDTDLIPKTRKLTIESRPIANSGLTEVDESPSFVLENKGEAFLTKGDVSVTDASEDAEDSDAVFLTPKIIKTKRKIEVKRDEPIEFSVSQIVEDTAPVRPLTFIDKLANENIAISDGDADEIEEIEEIEEIVPTEDSVSQISANLDVQYQVIGENVSLFLYYLSLTTLLLLILLTLTMHSTFIYQAEAPFVADFTFSIDVHETILLVSKLVGL